MDQTVTDKIKHFLEKHNLMDSENVLLIGFSGGIDSLCLLDVLYNLSKQYNFKVIAAHLNHNWRGITSRLEKEKAENYCLEKKITFYSETLPENLPHTELEARNQRYKFFDKASKKFNVTTILTGHTLTDQVETVLYRIIKGTGLNGLQGIPEIRTQKNAPDIYRPILTVTRDETFNYCKEKGLSPSFDESNLDEKYFRNRIRLSLISELKSYNPKIEDAILRLSAVASDSEKLINEYLGQIRDKIYLNDKEINSQEFFKLSCAAKKRIILELLLDNKIDYSFVKIDEIIDFIEENKSLKSGNTMSLTTNRWLFISSQIIKIIHQIKSDVLKFSLLVEFNKENFHPELKKTIKITKLEEEKLENFPPNSANYIFADLSSINEPVYLRTRQAGDRFQPLGMKEKTKLKKYLINKGIPEFRRDEIPVLATESEILWVVGIGMSELIKVKNFATHKLEVF